MKITKIIIPEFRQFKDFTLDLTYPKGHEKAGQPLEKVCFIGRNGVGKSNLLYLVDSIISDKLNRLDQIVAEIKFENLSNYLIATGDEFFFLSKDVENHPDWTNKLKQEYVFLNSNLFKKNNDKNALKYFQSIHNYPNLLCIYSPPESDSNKKARFQKAPPTTVNDALQLFKSFPFHHTVSNDTVSEFWKNLIYHIKKRENDFRDFENKPENQNKTVKEVRKEFNKKNPEILHELAGLWNRILEKAFLEFDYENAKNPVQLNDNLEAYIKLKNNGQYIDYNMLSTGIRNYLFRLGHIFSLYFNTKVENGFLLIDEPENSLFPDFLYDLIDIYQSVIHNTQFFVATQNPIISAQFDPAERIILEFDKDGSVYAARGNSPEGDDPNDILKNDFGVRNILGSKGLEMWDRFVELKKKIRNAKDQNEKMNLIEEFSKIGKDYNFD